MRELVRCYSGSKENSESSEYIGNKELWNEFTNKCKMDLSTGQCQYSVFPTPTQLICICMDKDHMCYYQFSKTYKVVK